MDNNTKIANQDANTVTPPVVGSIHKEGAPIGVVEVRPSGAEVSHEIHQELKDLGVQETQDKPDLTPEYRSLGIEHAGEAIPVPVTTSSLTPSSLTRKEIKVINVQNSRRWWEELWDKVTKATRLKEVTS